MEKTAVLAAVAGLSQESRLDIFRLLFEQGREGMPAGTLQGRELRRCLRSLPSTQEQDLMKRFHVHVSVGNLDEGIAFYSKLFGDEPTVRKADYAKWMVDDPRINFAISVRGGKPGINHLGFQLDSDEEFRAMHAQLAAADAGLVEELGAHCCYANSDKYWVTDPAGVAWETYHTLGSIPDVRRGRSGRGDIRLLRARDRDGEREHPRQSQVLRMTGRVYNVPFLCTGNSARSIIAESLLNAMGKGRFRAFSAGSRPGGRVNPHVADYLESVGLPTAGARSKWWDEFAHDDAPKMGGSASTTRSRVRPR
jgi:catechol 2,3-dioxygenase-like lactoylglutathione lyase family enzyme